MNNLTHSDNCLQPRKRLPQQSLIKNALNQTVMLKVDKHPFFKNEEALVLSRAFPKSKGDEITFETADQQFSISLQIKEVPIQHNRFHQLTRQAHTLISAGLQ